MRQFENICHTERSPRLPVGQGSVLNRKHASTSLSMTYSLTLELLNH
jgi:hypothetical protein